MRPAPWLLCRHLAPRSTGCPGFLVRGSGLPTVKESERFQPGGPWSCPPTLSVTLTVALESSGVQAGPMASPALHLSPGMLTWDTRESRALPGTAGIGAGYFKAGEPLVVGEGRDSRVAVAQPREVSAGPSGSWLPSLLCTPPSCLLHVLQATHHGQVLGLRFLEELWVRGTALAGRAWRTGGSVQVSTPPGWPVCPPPHPLPGLSRRALAVRPTPPGLSRTGSGEASF